MRIVCVGGGPAGLYFALLMKRLHPAHEITVIERNQQDETFGWGVVFSDATMTTMRLADPSSASRIESAFNHWDDIEVVIHGRRMRTTGHGFVGIGRQRLLSILQSRCVALGVELVFGREVESDVELDADLIVAADGVNSRVRQRHAALFEPKLQVRPNRYIWLGTRQLFDSFTFDFRRTEHGWFQAHIYRFDKQTSTCIIETTEPVFRAHGLGEMDVGTSIAFCQGLFAETLNGQPLLTKLPPTRGSAWLNFGHLACGRWHFVDRDRATVLVGDAAHTAHFAIGSGTKLAIEDAIELARCYAAVGHERTASRRALADYEAARKLEVARLQNAARNAMQWFEVVGHRYADRLPPEQVMYSLLTRSMRIGHDNLRARDRVWLEGFERWFADQASPPDAATGASAPAPPPMFTPFRLRQITFPNRVVVSPMAVYSALDGVPGDFHLAHLVTRAAGGAGLVFGEMTCVAPDARITPACAGLWNQAQAAGWRRIVELARAISGAKLGLQLGHAGRKGSTRVPWEGEDEPLAVGNWRLISASAIPYLPHGPLPVPMSRTDMDRVRAEFERATRLAADIGFDILELHSAHGYLLSSFLSPLTNQRDDEYGGCHANRARFPLEICRTVRAIWPAARPLSVRLSCHDWAPGGNTDEDAAIFAGFFKAAGADIIDCSSGQVWKDQSPIYGRLYQTPFADRIRNEVGIPTIAVGAITEADQVNSIIAAGRADLCALARPHLADPAWTLHAAARLGVEVPWPRPYEPARRQHASLVQRASSSAA